MPTSLKHLISVSSHFPIIQTPLPTSSKCYLKQNNCSKYSSLHLCQAQWESVLLSFLSICFFVTTLPLVAPAGERSTWSNKLIPLWILSVLGFPVMKYLYSFLYGHWWISGVWGVCACVSVHPSSPMPRPVPQCC